MAIQDSRGLGFVLFVAGKSRHRDDADLPEAGNRCVEPARYGFDAAILFADIFSYYQTYILSQSFVAVDDLKIGQV